MFLTTKYLGNESLFTVQRLKYFEYHVAYTI